MEPQKNTNPTILLADDCPFTFRAVSAAIEKFLPGCRVAGADSIRKAQSLAAEMAVDLFLVDMTLPDGSGIDFLADMKTAHSRAGFITMTDGPLPAHVGRTGWLNDVQFVRKPVHRARLLRLIQKMLKIPSDITSAPPHGGREVWSARLNDTPPEEIIRFQSRLQATMVLEFISRGETGIAHFLNGKLTHVETGELDGPEALRVIVNWRQGYAFELPGELPRRESKGSHFPHEATAYASGAPEVRRETYSETSSIISSETDFTDIPDRIPA